MVAGHLREKSGYYYAVLNYTDSLGKRKTKWISTGLTVKGNKKRAEAILMDARRNFNPEEPKVMNGDVLFADYMEKWLDIIKNSVAVPTFASYSTTVKKIVAPYFREKEVTLKNLTAKDIQEFYLSELERVSPSSVIHYHANIHKALKYAVKIDLIDVNPADKVERPKKDRYVGSFYDADEVNALFEAAKGSKLELPILFGAFYGLRRSEAIGLKWDAIDFDQNTITIRHTVTSCDLDGKRVLVASDTTKTKSSMRTLPLVPFMRERLLTLKEEQQENRRLCGRSYHKLPENIRVVGCWAHLRRKFDEAVNALPKEQQVGCTALEGLQYCNILFAIEKELADLPPEERYIQRLARSKPVMDALLAWAETKTAPPKSSLGKALYYLREQWPYLKRFLEDGRLEISNNRAERSIKPFVMGRKNWLFANTEGGAQSSAIVYSLIETARENNLDPYRYLVHVFSKAPGLAVTDKNWAAKLLPENIPPECCITKK